MEAKIDTFDRGRLKKHVSFPASLEFQALRHDMEAQRSAIRRKIGPSSNEPGKGAPIIAHYAGTYPAVTVAERLPTSPKHRFRHGKSACREAIMVIAGCVRGAGCSSQRAILWLHRCRSIPKGIGATHADQWSTS